MAEIEVLKPKVGSCWKVLYISGSYDSQTYEVTNIDKDWVVLRSSSGLGGYRYSAESFTAQHMFRGWRFVEA